MTLFDGTSRRLRRFGGAASASRASSTGGLSEPVHSVAPGAREVRAQAVHRLQVGLFGLATMLLLVSLASIIMDRVHTADRSAVVANPTGEASAASDPLVDLGVAPELPVGANDPARKPAKAGAGH